MKPQRTRVSAYALLHQSGKILLCRLSPDMPRWAGVWTLPGGGLEFGEPPAAAATREVAEETGLQIRLLDLVNVDSIHDTSQDSDFHGIRILYAAEVIGGELKHEIAGSTDRCEWQELHSPLGIPLGDLAEVGMRVAREIWPQGE